MQRFNISRRHWLVLFSLWPTCLLAQESTPWSATPSGIAIAPGAAGAGATFEQYNSFNGYLNASFPLRHIGGRGDAAFDLVWNLQPGWVAAYNGTPGTGFVAVDPYPSNNIAGATSNSFGLGGPGCLYPHRF